MIWGSGAKKFQAYRGSKEKKKTKENTKDKNKIEVFQHHQYLTEVKNKSGEWHKTTQKCLKDKHVNKDVANVWERGELPHRLEDSRIVIALLDRVIGMKENQIFF